MIIRTLSAVALCALLLSPAKGQTYGVLLAGGASNLYAAGQTFAPQHSISAGLFMPFFVFDRFVVRTEAGITAQSRTRSGTDEQAHTSRLVSFNAAVLGRYYVQRKVSFSLGFQWNQATQDPEPVSFGHSKGIPNRSDLCLLVGTAYRPAQRIEVGVRLEQGLLAALDMGPYGIAHHRYAFLTASYLLRSRTPHFKERRLWRNPLYLGKHY